jgi:hypothetical protein
MLSRPQGRVESTETLGPRKHAADSVGRIEVAPVDTAELVYASVLVVLLLAMGGYYFWRQVRILRKLRFSTDTLEDKRFVRTQAIRRLVCSGLILLFAVLLPASYLLEGILPNGDATEEDKPALYAFESFWLGMLILILIFMCVAAIDLLAARRYTLRQLRKLDQQREDLFAQQAARVRSQRNGPG